MQVGMTRHSGGHAVCAFAIVLVGIASGGLGVRVHVSPSQCSPTTDCYETIQSAIAQCNVSKSSCQIVLAPGQYRIKCPPATRNSSAQTEAPAIAITSMNDITFGGDVGVASDDRPELLIDYNPEGCAAFGVSHSTDVILQNIVMDAYRQPFTTATVVNVGSTTLQILPEQPQPNEDRSDIYAWDIEKYPWIQTVEASAVVGRGKFATRQLPEIGLSNVNFSSSVDQHTRVVTLTFDTPSTERSNLRVTDRIFMKHYNNMQSWGPYGFNVSGFRLENLSLWGASGMGYRCDFCSNNYDLVNSQVAIKPKSVRPMSITADAIHFMHHGPGKISVIDSSMQGQGDDGFNVHGNFVVVNHFIDAHTAIYIDETGPGWITATPTHLIGDQIQFYSRATLQPIGERNVITAATATTVVFRDALPVDVKLFDMFLSMTRVASLEIRNSFFGNSNARGLIISAKESILINNTFANLSLPAIEFFEGGCGAQAGDYTEGPFSSNIIIQNNTFDACAGVDQNVNSANNLGVLELMGCRPIGDCGSTGSLPLLPYQAYTVGDAHTPMIRAVKVFFNGGATLKGFKYATMGEDLQGLQMGLYASSSDYEHPTKLVAMVTSANTWVADGVWRSSILDTDGGVTVTNGTYWLVIWYPAGQLWSTPETQGSSLYANWFATAGLPKSLGANWSDWNSGSLVSVPIALDWTPTTRWCDVSATLPPAVSKHIGDEGDGRITEPGEPMTAGTIFSNATISNNIFIAQHNWTAAGRPHQTNTWDSNFIRIGTTHGVTVVNNEFRRLSGVNVFAADVVVYSSSDVDVADNTCTTGESARACTFSNTTLRPLKNYNLN
eukprot:m.146702 g.146702  ORF g.146702 m.146702 type:complete len:837 (+) comp30490_c0_seq2:212-2722(+)